MKSSLLPFPAVAGFLLASGQFLAAGEPDLRAALVGTWKIVDFHDDGRPRLERLGASPKAKKGQKPRTALLVVTPQECWILRGDGRREATPGLANCAWKSFTLDPAQKPIAIDLVGFAGKDGSKTRTYAGILELQKDRLRICWNEMGKTRPTAFASDGAMNLLVCERLSKEITQPAP